jgi:hypothetical protein
MTLGRLPEPAAGALCVGLLVLWASLATAANVWDDGTGLEVTGHSALLPVSAIRSIFGAPVGSLDGSQHVAMFADGQPEPFVHWLEWQTPEPVQVRSIRISANGDYPQSTNRQFKAMRLYAQVDGKWLLFCELRTPGPYTWEDPSKRVLRTVNLAEPVRARQFRAEFDQHDVAPGQPSGGPRILLLEGFDAPLPVSQRAVATGPKFFNLILHNQGADSLVGLHRFVEGARGRGLLGPLRMTIILNGEEAQLMPGEKAFFRELYDQGHEIAAEWARERAAVADFLGLPAAAITTLGSQLFSDADLEEQALDTTAGVRASAHACVEGNSLAEFWDVPHNWEGAPMFPYWVQWNAESPLLTNRTNRELDRDRAVLELQWSTRTLWHNYDRFPIPQCWHFGEPLKKQQWNVGQLVRRGEKGGWWRVELEEYERNLRLGRTPYLYLNSASEANIFTPAGPWSPMLDNDEALECALDVCQLLSDRDWRLVTVREFADWFAQQWPCPAAPSMIYLVNDTLANRTDRDGRTILGHGRLLHAETRHFQISDHENRIAPELVIAYDLRTPNLLRGGYTFASPEAWTAKESWDGHYASTTGNALFWSPSEPLADVNNVPYFPPAKDPACRARTFTLYLGESWEPYQFAPGAIFGVLRAGDTLRWSKEMAQPVAGTDLRVIYHHTLDGPTHRVRVEVLGGDAVGKPVHLRLAPYFHQGWDHGPPVRLSDLRVPDPATVGQERHVFGRVGSREFAYSESNTAPRRETQPLAGGELHLFNRNPGAPGSTYDDNPAFNRGLTVRVTNATDATVDWIDEAGPQVCVTAELQFGPHRAGRQYEFAFRYWPGAPQ